MTYHLSLRLDGLPPMNTSHTRGHWSKAHREVLRWRTEIAVLTHQQRPAKPLAHARLTITRHSSVEPDLDNAAQAVKPILDALVSAGILLDDSPRVLARVYLWQRAAPRKGFIQLELEETES